MAILNTIKKGYMHLKVGGAYIKLLPRTLATLVSMSDGRSVENAIDELNRKLNKVYRTKPVSGVEVVRVGNTVTLYVNRVVEGVQGNFVYSGHFGTVPPGYRPATENSLLLVGDRIVGSTVVGKFYASIFPDGKIEWSSENSHSGPNSYVFYATYVTSDQLPVE